MTNFVDFARNSFVKFCTDFPKGEDGKHYLICYKNDGNRIIYANRFGQVFKLSIHGDEVIQQEFTYPAPSDVVLNTETMNWLRGIAMSKRWRGGVAKLDKYLDVPVSQLDVDGIDPYFYAWMASRHYKVNTDEVNVVETSFNEDEYDKICKLVQIQDSNGNCDDVDIDLAIIGYNMAKADGYTFDQWVSGTCGGQMATNEMFRDISNLVDKWGNSSYELKMKIHELISNWGN